MPMQKLLHSSRYIYKYFKAFKHVANTYMTLEPQQALCVKHIEGLGFSVKNKMKKEALIDLSHKQLDPRHILSLAYYSMALSSIFLPEGTIACLIESHQTIGRDELYEKGRVLTDVLCMENLYPKMDYHEHGFESRVGFFKSQNVLMSNEDGKLAVVQTPEAKTLLEFFVGLTQPILDTYLVMLLAIEHLHDKPIVIPVRKLIKEMHKSIKELCAEEHLPHLHSCLKITILTALRRFENMGFLQMSSFGNKKGTMTTFM